MLRPVAASFGAPRSLFPLPLRAFVWLKRLQAAAGLVFASYVLAHLGNAVLLVGGHEVAARFLGAMRRVTGSGPGRALWIIVPLAVHAALAAAVLLQERSLRARAREALARAQPGAAATFGTRRLSARVHRLSGFLLLFLVPLHVIQMRHGALGETVAAGGYERAAVLAALHPVGVRVGLLLLVLAAAYHLGYGVWMALINLGLLGPGRPRRRGRIVGIALSGAAALSGAVGIAAL